MADYHGAPGATASGVSLGAERRQSGRATTDRRLSPAHRQRLRDGGLRDDVIDARGYWTATVADLDAVKRLGHNVEILAEPVLMLPLHDVFGFNAFTVARPDAPRLGEKGKPKKYEIPRGARVTLDVHPTARRALTDPDVPLWVVEGQKKGDAALSNGAGCAIALLGVWCWKKFATPAWDAVTLRDRTVYLAFDSDCATNPKVAQALHKLQRFLEARGATVLIIPLEPGPNGEKRGLDDVLAAGAT
jgi:putative DNA primase/helicase